MKPSNLLTIIMASMSILCSCKKIDQQSTNFDKIVVEGYLKPEQKIAINVKKEIAFASLDTSSVEIEGLEISLTNNDLTEIMIDKGSGVYESNSIIGKSLEKYNLHFVYKGQTIESETIIPIKPSNYTSSATSISMPNFEPSSGTPPSFPDPINLSWNNQDKKYYLVVVENIESNPTKIRNGNKNDLKKIFRNKPSLGNSYQLNLQNFSYYVTHRVILFNINPEYAALYEDNGNSSLNLTTPPSNITGGLGIFTGINSDTLIVEVY